MQIAIVGAYPGTRLAAPYTDPDWTIWCCSFRNMGQVPRHDLWFELHEPPGHEKYVAWLSRQPSVMVRSERGKAWAPQAQVYPEDEVRQQFGPYFLTSSVAYMMALAIRQQPSRIGLWGVEMVQGHEYQYQRPGCHFFIQRARDHGIEISASRGLLEPPKEEW